MITTKFSYMLAYNLIEGLRGPDDDDKLPLRTIPGDPCSEVLGPEAESIDATAAWFDIAKPFAWEPWNPRGRSVLDAVTSQSSRGLHQVDENKCSRMIQSK